MATTASGAANSASLISHYSIDSSMSRSRRDSSPWMDSDAIHGHPAPSVSQVDHFLPPVTPSVYPPTGKDISDNADKKPVWNKPSTSSSEVGPVMGAVSWPALTDSARASSNKSPSLESCKVLSDGSSSAAAAMQAPQAAGTPLNPTSNANANTKAGSSVANVNAKAGSSAAATSVEKHNVNGQRKPFFRRNNNNNTSSSSSNIISNSPNVVAAAPLNARDQNHSQRGGGSYGTQFRNSNRNRNNNNNNNNNSSSYPRGDGFQHGNRRNYEHGNQSGFSHRNNYEHGRDMHLQPQRGFGGMRPQMMMGPPSFPGSSAQYMAATPIGSYGGPMLYQDYAPHIFMPQQPSPDAIALVGVGQFQPLPMYLPSVDATMLYSKILKQVEYYFSADNLSRDQYLRGCMNDEGWVCVRIIAGFRKLAELTNNLQTILEALRSSQVVEVKGETIRRRGDWDKYLLPREPSSRSGPASMAASSNNATPLGGSMTTLSES